VNRAREVGMRGTVDVGRVEARDMEALAERLVEFVKL
jgi:hypothetical protein